MEFTFAGEAFLKTLKQALADELQESRDAGPHSLVTNADVDYELKLLAMWLARKFMSEDIEEE